MWKQWGRGPLNGRGWRDETSVIPWLVCQYRHLNTPVHQKWETHQCWLPAAPQIFCCLGQKVSLVHPDWENQSFPLTSSASADTGTHVPAAKPLYSTSCSGWSNLPAPAKAGRPGSTTRLTLLPRGSGFAVGTRRACA